jgi:2,5-diketo-D-gluconate reductase B
MEYVNVKGQEVPSLGFGTWQIKGRECSRAVSHALELGYRHIDTAQVYENEEYVGEGISAAGLDRDQLFVTSKVWRTNVEPDKTIESTEESLRRLDLEYIDLMLIHWPVEDVPFEKTLDAMLELREQNKIRHFGISNFTPSQVERVLDHTDVFCNQVEYHPYLDQTQLHEMAVENDMMLTAYSPLARGRVLNDRQLSAIGERYGKSPAQVTLRWLSQKENVAVIPKASSRDHRKANLEIFDFELSGEEMGQIDDLATGDRLISPSFAPNWGS